MAISEIVVFRSVQSRDAILSIKLSEKILECLNIGGFCTSVRNCQGFFCYGECALALRSQIATSRLLWCQRDGPSGFRGQSRRSCRGDVGGFVKNRDENNFGKGSRSAAAPIRNRDIGDRAFVWCWTKRLCFGGRKREPFGVPVLMAA